MSHAETLKNLLDKVADHANMTGSYGFRAGYLEGLLNEIMLRCPDAVKIVQEYVAVQETK
jgi:hypothetical protein